MNPLACILCAWAALLVPAGIAVGIKLKGVRRQHPLALCEANRQEDVA